MGNSRVIPLKYISIPRLELVASTLSVKISVMLRKEHQFPDLKEIYWTDSKAVLGYIKISPSDLKSSLQTELR